MQIVPAVKPGVVTVIEADAHRVVADGLQRDDLHILLAGDDLFLAGAMALDFGARRFDAEILGWQDKALAGIVLNGQLGFCSVEPELDRPGPARRFAHRASRSASVSSRASLCSMI